MFVICSNKTFVTGDDDGYAIAWDARSKKKLVEVISTFPTALTWAFDCLVSKVLFGKIA